jgi:hypothetical protein
MSDEMQDVQGQVVAEQIAPAMPGEAQPAETGSGWQQDASGQAIGEAPQPVQPPEPEYITREELQRREAALQARLEEAERRFQSFADRSESRIRKELAEKIKQREAIYDDPDLLAYLGEDAAEFKRRKQQELVMQHFKEPPADVEAPQPNLMDHPTVKAIVMLTGVQPGDPEWIAPDKAASESEWVTAMAEAQKKKQRRLAVPTRVQAPPQPNNQTVQPSPVQAQTQPERKSAQVSLGTGEGPRTLDPNEAIAAYRRALDAGDRTEADRLSAVIDRMARGGGTA